MATVPAATAGPKKLSFAKVVASKPISKPKENVPIVSATRVAVPTMDHRVQSSTASTNPAATSKNIASTPAHSPTVATKSPPALKENGVVATPPGSEAVSSTKPAQSGKDQHASLSAASASSTPSLVVNGSSSSLGEAQSKNENGTSVSDDTSQRADSNSEMGTKAPSLDGKSITSGTTFALDEKESLRPDDSASVKAAAEDDEAFSVRGSLIANSRMGSEVARIHRLRIGDMPERRIVQILPEAPDQGVVTPQSGVSSQQPPIEQPQPLGIVNGSSDAFTSMYGQNPDEKLLEAMQSPKDRIFLLRLEQDVINFVQSSKEPYMDFPPNNSFCRMLTHKLADYYHMTHSFEAVQGSVRIYRTPFCRVPPSLASIAGTNTNASATTTPPQLLPKKIMRRGEDGGSGQASTSPSKATSEVGSDGKEKGAPTKEKLTREEREEAYFKAREKIFGTDKPGESTPENDDANGVSRASSVSAKDKSTLGKRGKTGKQRRDDSESFDSRSQYQPYYNPHQPNWTPHYVPIGHPQYNSPVQQPYQNQMPQAYAPPPQAYPTMMPNNAYPQYGSMPVYPPQTQPTPPRYTPSNGSMGTYGGPIQTPPQQQWQQPPNYPPQVPSSSPYQGRAPQPAAQGTAGSLVIPYAFGQLPANANPHDPKSQHPIPGSYNRHAFNPKTQSFVPGNGMMQVQPPIPPYNMGGHGSPQVGSPHLAYSGYASPAPPPQPYVGGPGYGMSRQGSNNSLPAYHPPQHLPQHPSAHLPQAPPQMPNKPSIPPPTGPGQTFSHLPTYGNPATLPQKPPTGI
ncbi:uncharacterized protein F4807DRAFT_192325 [Annulohypoxylon truncatum]|uniref:uncharacterized protein n=1 Tax=Annulohypoxylon truncatum TaxID=327061 RepID=UPI002008ACB3|nr:uncharacterized protein F4807DRAFT_192325 [Annulohypoxylon truncatum]KAI1207244.1 hypothetical protein F4807DRAFT_192325 [Annulohypoxylon truncatum]